MVLEALILPSINKFLSPAKDQHLQTLDYIYLPPAHNRHRDRLQPPHRTVCVVIDFKLSLTYNALGKSIASYAAPVWSTNASDSSFKKKQTAQNEALRTATGAHKMISIDHLHQESLTLKVKDKPDMISAQYLVNVWRRTTSVMASRLRSQGQDP